MQTYQATFELTSPCLTPWQSDTIFGHLCWAIVRNEGESALTSLLKRCEAGDPPLLLSDGFPQQKQSDGPPINLFPRPLVPPPPRPAEFGLTRQISAARQSKTLRDSRWLTPTGFRQALRGEPVDPAETRSNHAAGEHPFSILHNQISRATGTTGDEGSGTLYGIEGELAVSRVVYLRVADDIGLDWRGAFAEFALTGFGKRKSVGYGALASFDPDRDITKWEGFGEPENANGFVSLSAFVPAQGDPTNGQWRTDVKYGKLGEERAVVTSPFKRPFVRLLPGAAFRTDDSPRAFYGRMVENLHSAQPDVIQYGYAFAVPLRWNAQPDATGSDMENTV